MGRGHAEYEGKERRTHLYSHEAILIRTSNRVNHEYGL